MALTIKLTQLKRKKRKDGTIPIYIRMTEDQKSRYRSTGISVLPKHWNPNEKRVRKSHRNDTLLNNKLEGQLIEIKQIKHELSQNKNLSLDTLKQAISEDSDPRSVQHQAKEYRQHLNAEERYWEYRHFKVVMNNLDRFIKEKDVPNALDQIDSEWIENFQDFLLTEGGPEKKDGTRKGNSANTVRKKLQRLKGMFTWLIKNKNLKHDPFTRVDRVEKKKANTKTKLTFQQIKTIKELKLQKESKLWHVRNYFMYSFYNAGIRFGDLCTLTWDNLVDGRLTYSMHKTGKRKSIKQLKPMEKILNLYRDKDSKPTDYIFPILDDKYSDPMELRKAIGSKNARVNLMLKDIASEADIEANISFHVSRHSFAHFALKKGMDLYSISKALGHSDLKITEQYLKSFDEEKLDSDMEEIFSN